MQEYSTSSIPPASEGNMNLLQRIINVFAAPGKCFAAVRANPRWIAPTVLVLLLSLIMTIYIMPAIQKEQHEKMVTQMEDRGMDQEQIDSAIEKMNTPVMKYVMFGSAVIGGLAGILVMAGLWLFVARTLLGGTTSFKHMLEVVSLSMLIPSVGMLLKAPIMRFKETMNVHFSLATFMPDSARETFLYKFLMNTDFFNLWYIAVLCIGIAVVAGLNVKKVWPVVAGLLVLWYLGSAAIGGLFS